MRERLMVSFFIAVLIHFILLLVLQLVLKIERARPPEYAGPLYITLQEVPVEAPVIEQAREPQPRLQQETPRVEQPPQAQPRPQGPAADLSQLPWFRPAPPTETTRPAAEPPRTGLQVLPPTTPRSQEPYLPPDQQATQPPPAQAEPSRQPQPTREVPSSQQAEVRPQSQPEQPSVLDLRRLDSTISQPEGGPAAPGAAREGAAAATPGPGGPSAQEGREGFEILWDDPSQSREATSMPRPVVPAFVARDGLTLQVRVAFVLTPQGVLEGLKVERSSGYPEVDAAILEALRRWKFRPVSTERRISGRVTYTITAR